MYLVLISAVKPVIALAIASWLLQFTQLKADGQVRWAVLNVASVLRQYSDLQDRLAEEMQRGRPVGQLLRMMDERVAAALERENELASKTLSS